MIDTKIIFTSVLVVSLYISTVKANCESVTIESRQTLDFGLLRLLPDSSRGSAILWEDGGYYLDFPAFTRQLIVSQSSPFRIEPAKRRLYASAASEDCKTSR